LFAPVIVFVTKSLMAFRTAGSASAMALIATTIPLEEVCETSKRFPHALESPCNAPPSVSRAAAAEPPICVSSSLRMIRCASAARPDATKLLTRSVCDADNCTPARRRAPIPAMGSFSAFPSCRAEVFRSWPKAVLMSRIACVASRNTSPRTFVNVAKRACAPTIASSSYVETLDN
jgi:hypothetical protein